MAEVTVEFVYIVSRGKMKNNYILWSFFHVPQMIFRGHTYIHYKEIVVNVAPTIVHSMEVPHEKISNRIVKLD